MSRPIPRPAFRGGAPRGRVGRRAGRPRPPRPAAAGGSAPLRRAPLSSVRGAGPPVSPTRRRDGSRIRRPWALFTPALPVGRSERGSRVGVPGGRERDPRASPPSSPPPSPAAARPSPRLRCRSPRPDPAPRTGRGPSTPGESDSRVVASGGAARRGRGAERGLPAPSSPPTSVSRAPSLPAASAEPPVGVGPSSGLLPLRALASALGARTDAEVGRGEGARVPAPVGVGGSRGVASSPRPSRAVARDAPFPGRRPGPPARRSREAVPAGRARSRRREAVGDSVPARSPACGRALSYPPCPGT